jgi:EAL domain-containing protein (putative c-di-GMP-specific phosphodiesterase class I)
LAHALDLSVVAEGMETPAVLEFLRDAGCDEGQGHLFSRPLPLPEFQLFLSRLPSLPARC